MRTMRLARFGDNMRDVAVTEGDKVEAELQFGVSVNTYGVNDLVASVDAVDRQRRRRAGREYEDDVRRRRPSCARGGERHESLRYGARIELGLRAFLEDGGFTAFTTNFEDLGGLRQLPGLAVQRLMADGYGFGGEGDWKTVGHAADAEGHGPGPARRHVLHGGLHLRPDARRGEDPRRAHARGLPVASPPARPTLRDPPARHRRPRGPGPAGLRRGPRRRRSSSARPTCGDRFRLVANEVEVVAPDAPLPKLPVARAVWQPAPDLRTSTEAWLTAGGPHHTVLSTALTSEHLWDLAEMSGTELALIDAATTTRRFTQELRWNQAYYRLAQGF